MDPIARLAAVTLDCSDPVPLADFYRSLLGLETMFESDGFIALKGAAVLLTMHRVDNHQSPQWRRHPCDQQGARGPPRAGAGGCNATLPSRQDVLPSRDEW